MLATGILRHAVRQVTGNLGAALRISAPPMILQYLAIFLISWIAMPGKAGLEGAVQNGHPPLGALALVAVVTVFCSTWLAVSWHRFILLAEMPSGPLPPLHGDRLVAYVGRSLLVILILVAAEFMGAIPILLVSGLFDVIARPLAALVALLGSVALMAVVATVFLRLSPMLPAAALGEDASLRMAWEATRGQDAPLLVLGVLVLAGLMVLSLPQFLFVQLGLTVFAVAWQIAASWAATLALLSLFTTLYGHFVQHRTLV